MSNDMWRTPAEVISYIESRFGEIKFDLCASDAGHVSKFYLTAEDDFLSDDTLNRLTGCITHGSTCWMNPPYSNPRTFVGQAIKLAGMGYGVAGILNLDTSTKWFVELEKHAQVLMPITGGRIAFLGSDGQPSNGNNKPQIMFYLAPFGSHVKTTEYVSIDEIYPNGKPGKRKND